MTLRPDLSPCGRTELVCAHAIHALPASEVAAVEAHIDSCERCREELATLRPVVEALVHWPTDILRPHRSLEERLLRRIAAEAGGVPCSTIDLPWREPEWTDVSRGIRCKILAEDSANHVVNLLVRLEAGTAYPPHVHAGVEELYLLDGELWIEDHKLRAGDYNRREPGTRDERVWSETGCTCLLITSTRDVLTVGGST